VNEDPVAVVQRGYDLIERGEIDAFFELLDDGIEWVDHAAIPLGGRLQGREQVEEHFRRWFAKWDEIHYTIAEIVGDGDRVVAAVHRRGRERETGVEREDIAVYVYDVCDGRLTRLTGYTDRAAAIAAAGLRR
jgi:ketosteroid isomerase-like protein